MPFLATIRRPPRTLTETEQARLLRVTGEHRAGFRDHVLYSLALGTGLREFELAALDVGDLSADGVHIRRRLALRVFKGSRRPGATAQEVFLPDAARHKLAALLRWKARQGESLAPDAPVFVSRRGLRLSTRRIRAAFVAWQEVAGLDRRHSFHELRHTQLTNLYRRSRDLRATQRAARHADVRTTTIYTEPSDEDMLRVTRDLPC